MEHQLVKRHLRGQAQAARDRGDQRAAHLSMAVAQLGRPRFAWPPAAAAAAAAIAADGSAAAAAAFLPAAPAACPTALPDAPAARVL
jgi:hypothetical protein